MIGSGAEAAEFVEHPLLHEQALVAVRPLKERRSGCWRPTRPGASPRRRRPSGSETRPPRWRDDPARGGSAPRTRRAAACRRGETAGAGPVATAAPAFCCAARPPAVTRTVAPACAAISRVASRLPPSARMISTPSARRTRSRVRAERGGFVERRDDHREQRLAGPDVGEAGIGAQRGGVLGQIHVAERRQFRDGQALPSDRGAGLGADALRSPVDAREELGPIALHPDQVVPAVGRRAENDIVLAQAGEGLAQDGGRQVGDIRAEGHHPPRAAAKGGRESLPQPDAEIAGRLRRIREISTPARSEIPAARPR